MKKETFKTVEYRTPQPSPTKPGWYYARSKNYEDDIRPVRVYALSSGFCIQVYIQDGREDCGIEEDYIWYGPVPTCVERDKK